VRAGHAVDLFGLHPDWENTQPRQFDNHGVRVTYAGPMHIRQAGNRKLYYKTSQLPKVLLTAVLGLARALYRSDAEIIHVCKSQPVNLLAARLARRGRPIYVDSDDYEAETNNFSSEWQRRLVRRFEDGIVRYAAGITTNTRFTRQRFVAMGYPQNRIIYVPNGIERQRFDPEVTYPRPAALAQFPDSSPLVVYIGTLGILSHPVDLLLEAFHQLLTNVPTARLVLVGGGEDYGALVALSQRLGIAEQTLFTGRVAPDEIPSYLAAATVTVDPVHDNLIAKARYPLKIVESLAMGVPVVTGDVGDSLADGLQQVLLSEGERPFYEAIAAHRETWYWDRLIDTFMKVYT
jgi:glycosyltransferase involved in cell wall biosynthesis